MLKELTDEYITFREGLISNIEDFIKEIIDSNSNLSFKKPGSKQYLKAYKY